MEFKSAANLHIFFDICKFYTFFSSFPHRNMEARLFPLVLDVNLAGSLMVEQHLSQNEFQIILVHIIACARNLIETHIREIKSGAVTVTGLRDGVDVSAALQVLDILLRTEYGSDVKTVMRQTVPRQYICPLGADRVQFALG